jgi:tetratricopeptide (TPR) repeat protein
MRISLRALAPWLIVVAGLAAYHNSFSGPFIFDDQYTIQDNPRIRRLWPIWDAMLPPPASSVAARPIVQLSFALNYALGGLDVRGYHALNLAIHLAAALLGYGLLRRTLARPGLALAASLLWVVHPLTTQSVTYLVQRAESLMGLCYLLTLYALARAAAPGAHAGWGSLAVLANLLGMATKPVMVTAPLAALAYDRTFLAGSVRQALRQRGGLYLGLAAGWGLLAGLLLTTPAPAEATAGFHLKAMSPLAYAATQPGVILHYLRLSLWPHPLVFDYYWPIARSAAEVVPPTLALAGILAGVGWLLRRHARVGFWALWAFLILLPSSSVIPIVDPAFEHRMYLPLLGLLVLLVLGGQALLARRPPWLAGALVGTLVLVLGVLTVRRNADYRSELSLWADTVMRRPQNPRAHVSLGNALTGGQRYEEAIAHYARALALDPDSVEAHNNWGIALLGQHRLQEATAHFYQALRHRPASAEVHFNLANALARQERLEDAGRHYAHAVRLAPDFPGARVNWGNVLALQGDIDGAIAQYTEALRLAPGHAVARRNLERLRSQARN